MDEDQSIVDWDGGGSKVMYVATRSPHPRILSIGSLARVCFARACAVPRLYARRPQLLPIQKARRSRSLCRESCPLSPRRILPRRPALSPHRSPRSVYIPSACLRTVCILFASCLHPVCACLRPACVLPASCLRPACAVANPSLVRFSLRDRRCGHAQGASAQAVHRRHQGAPHC